MSSTNLPISATTGTMYGGTFGITNGSTYNSSANQGCVVALTDNSFGYTLTANASYVYVLTTATQTINFGFWFYYNGDTTGNNNAPYSQMTATRIA